MKFLNHLDLNENEARKLKMYRVSSSAYTPSNVAGNIIFDTLAGQLIPKWWDGSNWRDFSYNTTGGQDTTYDLTVPTGTTKIRLVGSDSTNDDVEIFGGTNVTVTRTSATKLTLAATNTTYTAGTGLTLSTTTFNANTWGVNSSANASADSTETDERWYGVHTDSNDKLVVRVPWTDTNTNTQNAYAISAADGTTTAREKIVLTGSGAAGSTTDFIEIGAGTGLSIARSSDVITLTNTVTNTNTTYTAGNNLTLVGTTFDVPILTNTTLGVAKTRWSTTFSGTPVSLGDSFTTNRVYGVIKDTSNRLVVEVPWVNTQTTNTDANYALSVGAVSSNESTLSLVGSSGGSTTTAKFSGTANEIEITTPATGNGGDITIGLPDDVTIGNDLAVTNDLTVTGDLTVNGTTTTLDTTNTAIKDNIIILNSGQTSAFTGTSGIEVERGSTLPHSQVLWNDSTNKWTCSVGDTSLSMANIIQNVFTTVGADDSNTVGVVTPTSTVKISGSNGIATTADDTNKVITVSGASIMAQFSKVATIGATGINASTNKIATITHSLGTKDIVVRLYETNGEGNYTEIYADVTVTSTSVVKVQFSANLTVDVRAVIMAAKSASAVTPTYS